MSVRVSRLTLNSTVECNSHMGLELFLPPGVTAFGIGRLSPIETRPRSFTLPCRKSPEKRRLRSRSLPRTRPQTCTCNSEVKYKLMLICLPQGGLTWYHGQGLLHHRRLESGDARRNHPQVERRQDPSAQQAQPDGLQRGGRRHRYVFSTAPFLVHVLTCRTSQCNSRNTSKPTSSSTACATPPN